MSQDLSIIEKLKDVLTRNYSTIPPIEITEYKQLDFNLLSFKMHSGFSSNDLKHIFRYWGVDWKFHIKQWNVENNNNISVRVKLFLYKNIKYEGEKHDFIFRKDWGVYNICNKCGLFERPKGLE